MYNLRGLIRVGYRGFGHLHDFEQLGPVGELGLRGNKPLAGSVIILCILSKRANAERNYPVTCRETILIMDAIVDPP